MLRLPSIEKAILINASAGISLGREWLGKRVKPGATEGGPPTFLLEGSELLRLRTLSESGNPVIGEAINALGAMADALLELDPPAVTAKSFPPTGGTLNDYYSLGKYWWPQKDATAPYVKRDGSVNPEAYSATYDAVRLVTFSDAIMVLSLAAYFRPGGPYASKARELLWTWFLDSGTRQSPHFRFAQVTPGHDDIQGFGIVEARYLIYVTEAIRLLASEKHVSDEDLASLKEWFAELLAWLRNSKQGQRARTSKNNIRIWYEAQCLAFGSFIDDRQAIAQMATGSLWERVVEVIDYDGSLPTELSRARPHDYIVFSLLGMALISRMGEHQGVDLWTQEAGDGRSFEVARNWLAALDGSGKSCVVGWNLATGADVGGADAAAKGEVPAVPERALDDVIIQLGVIGRLVRGQQRIIVARDTSIRDLRTRSKEDRSALAELERKAGQITATLAQAESERDTLRASLTMETDRAQTALAASEAEVSRIRVLLAHAEKERDEELALLNSKLTEHCDMIRQLESALAETKRDRDEARFRGELAADREREAVQLKTELSRMQRERAEERAEIHVMLAERDRETGRLEAALSEVRRSESRLRHSIAKLEGELHELRQDAGQRAAARADEAEAEGRALEEVRSHRDELAARSRGLLKELEQGSVEVRQAKGAVSRVKNQLSYRIGQAIATNAGSPLALLRIPHAIYRARRDYLSSSKEITANLGGVPALKLNAETGVFLPPEPVAMTIPVDGHLRIQVTGRVECYVIDKKRVAMFKLQSRHAAKGQWKELRVELNGKPQSGDIYLRTSGKRSMIAFTLGADLPIGTAEVELSFSAFRHAQPVRIFLKDVSLYRGSEIAPPTAWPKEAGQLAHHASAELHAKGKIIALRKGTSPVEVHARSTESGALPREEVEKLRLSYLASELAGRKDDFVLFRVIGNDLPPRHRARQSHENLRFTLENEPVLANCEKRWVLNRIVDQESESDLIALLDHHQQQYLRIPFATDEYRTVRWRVEGFPEPGFFYSAAADELGPEQQQRMEDTIYHYKNLYVMNNNGARNAALRAGRALAKWVLPWDGNCFVTEPAWREMTKAVTAAPYLKFFVVPMARVLCNAELLQPDFVPVTAEEPQLLFRADAEEEFDEHARYGRRPKVNTFYRLGIRGKWDQWALDPWETAPSLSPERGQFGEAGWVARLFSGVTELELESKQSFKNRGLARIASIKRMIDAIDESLVRESFTPNKLLILDEARLAEQKRAFEAQDKGLVRIIGSLIGTAEEALGRGPFTVIQKETLPPSGDPHDYWHPAPYWWPDPAKPNSLPYIKKDGHRVPGTELYESGSDRYDRTRLQRLFDDTFALSLAWLLTSQDRFANHAAELVRTWFVKFETRMNPHLTYSQVRMGRNRNEGYGTGIIEMKDFYYFLDAVRLIERSGALEKNEIATFKAWLRSYLDWIRASKQGHSERARKNNHGTLYDLQVAAIAAYLDDIRGVLDVLKLSQQRIVHQFDPDGAQPFEMNRATTQHYCAFNLQSWSNLATFAQSCGVDLWRYELSDGRSIRQGFDWLLAKTAEPWPYPQVDAFDPLRYQPLQYQADRIYGAEISRGIPDMCSMKPIFFPHYGVRPFWMLGA